MKDKNYKSSRGAGDGNLKAGLLGMMDGGGATEYPAMMKAQPGGEPPAITHQQQRVLDHEANHSATPKGPRPPVRDPGTTDPRGSKDVSQLLRNLARRSKTNHL